MGTYTRIPVDLSICLPQLTGPEANLGQQKIMGNPYLFICRPVSMSTCLPGLTGPEVFIGEQGIMGIPFLTGSEVNIGEQMIIFTFAPVNPGRQVDRSTGEQNTEYP